MNTFGKAFKVGRMNLDAVFRNMSLVRRVLEVLEQNSERYFCVSYCVTRKIGFGCEGVRRSSRATTPRGLAFVSSRKDRWHRGTLSHPKMVDLIPEGRGLGGGLLPDDKKGVILSDLKFRCIGSDRDVERAEKAGTDVWGVVGEFYWPRGSRVEDRCTYKISH
eukprot:559957-Amorphochlora_amoeboformis.AAC.1